MLATIGVDNGSAAASTSQLAFAPVADAYVDSKRQNKNHGRETSLRVRSSSPAETTYLKFTVTGAAGPVTSARLRLYVTDPSASGGAVHSVSSTSWSETGITWSNAPALGATALAAVGRTSASTWVEIDLGGAIPGDGTYSFAVKGTSTDTAVYASREAANRPQLLLTIGPSAPVNKTPPTVSGTAEEGETLTASTGAWSGNPAPTYAFQWLRCDSAGAACADIPGAVGRTYALGFVDAGRTIRVRVTATNSEGAASADSAPTAVVKATSLSLPVRAAFYYGWYPENWLAGMPYTPSLGLYDSGDSAVIKQHIKSMQYAGVQAGIYSWWGRDNTGNNSTQRFPLVLDAAGGTGFKWAVYYEDEGYENPIPATIEADLAYIRDNYASSKNYLRVQGRPVVFVYSGVGDGCEMADRWRAANTIDAHVVLSTTWIDNSPQLASFAPYDPASTTAVRVAAADLTGDGKAEVVTVPGGGAPAEVNVFDAAGAKLASFLADTSGSLAGAFVAAGDVTGDGRAEIVVALGGTAPLIRVFALAGDAVATQLASFDAGLASPARVAVGDVNGDGKGEIVAATGPNTTPVVKVFSGEGTLLSELAPYDSTFTRGVHVAAGNVTGDARAEIIVGSADGTRNEVRVLDAEGKALVPPFAAYDGFGGAITVAAGDVNGDGEGEVVTGASGGPRVRSFTLRLGRPSGLASFFAYESATRGQIHVAAADVAGEATADIVTGSAAGKPVQAKVFGNVRDCASQPDDWHEYLVTASGESTLGRDSFTATPGFWRAGEAAPALPRDSTRWDANVHRMVASAADWQLVLSFNEWGESTSVESAREWATPSGFGLYLDILRAATTGTTSTISSTKVHRGHGRPASPATFPVIPGKRR